MSGHSPCEDDAKFFELLKILLEQVVVQKTFPVTTSAFSASRGNPESQRGKVLGLGIVEVRSGTWVAPELLLDSGS